MKKTVALLISILVILPFLTSCEKETILTVDQTSISFSDNGGSQTVSLTANKPWTVSSSQGWCKISPTGGEEATSSRITITCDANTTYDARNCTVTFTCAELTKTVSVSQATNNGLQVSQTTYEVTKAAQQLNIEVKANVKFSVEVDNGCKDWVKYNTTKALTTSTVVLDIAENKTYDGREGKVTIKQDGGSLSSTITIKQSQLDGLFLTTSEYNLSNEKHTLTVEVKSNIDFEVKSEADWIKYVETKGLKTNQIILDIAANETYDAREGKVIVKQKNGDLSGTITVKQEQNFGLILSQTAFDLGNDAQTIEVEVKYNVDFDVVIPSGCKDWIKQVSTKGLNSRTYTFSIGKNETYDAREGSITFKQKNGSLSGTVSVKQSQNNGLFVTKSDYEINNESQTVNVEVKANIDFEVKSESDWVKVVETKGLKTSTIVLSIEENDSYDAREGKVSVTQKEGDLKGTINIKQRGKNGIVLPQTEFELTNEAQTLNVEVQSTVQFEVQISDSGKEWVSLVSTKALDAKMCSFSIKKNETYDNRQCIVTFKQKGGEMSNSITIKQDQTDILEVSPTEFTMDIEGGTISVNVKSNIGYDIAIAEDAVSWISQVESNATETGKISFNIASCADDVERTGKITVSKKEFKFTITVQQYSYATNTLIKFADEKVKAKLVEAFDTNKDGELSIREARAVKSIEGVFGAIKTYTSFEEFQYFTGVTTIPTSMFQSWNLLSKIKLPESITIIEQSAFRECVKLEQILIPNNVKFIGKSCFMGCSSLKTVTIPDSVQYLMSDASYSYSSKTDYFRITEHFGTFDSCTSLESVIIGSGVSEIQDATFYNCPQLKNVIFKGGTTEIRNDVFSGCSKLSTIELPSTLVSLGRNVFTNCSELVSLTIPEGVTSINQGTFSGCTKLHTLHLPDNISYIGNSAFYECVNLEDCYLPKSLSNILPYAYYGTGIKTVSIPDKVTNIGSYAFGNCKKLEKVTIPDSVTDIGMGAFSGCSSLKSITLPESISILKGRYDVSESRSTGTGVFEGCSSLKSITLPESLTEIEPFVFYECTGLETIEIPESVTKIGFGCFENCYSLKTIKLPNSVTEIKPHLFHGCKQLKEVALPQGLISIGNYAFYGCESLATLYFPDSVKEIYLQYTFAYCTSLKQIRIPDTVRYEDLFRATFSNCQSLTSINIPDQEGHEFIWEDCFYNCRSLSEVTIPERIHSIYFTAFHNCSGLTKIVVLSKTPPALVNGENAFEGSSCPIYVPKESLEAYKNSLWAKYYSSRIQPLP